MRVTKNSVVRISYVVQGDDGGVVDEASAVEPFEFFCGAGQLVPGFERALIGLRAGERKEFTVPAADAYGERDTTLIKTVPRASLPAHIRVRQGMRIPMRSPEGVELVCKILDVKRDSVVADFNHPLAGQALRCNVQILDVRSAN